MNKELEKAAEEYSVKGEYQFMSTFQQMAQKAFIAGANWQASNTIITDNSLVIDNKDLGLHGNPYSPIYPCPEVGKVITTANGTFNTTATTDVKSEEVFIEAWIARDKSDVLCLFNYKPHKRDVEWDCRIHVEPLLIESKFFPKVKWEDEEPTKVKLIIKKV